MLTQDLKSLRGMNALILGAGGFIGRHVVRALRAHGATVTGAIRPGARNRAQTSIEVDLSQAAEVQAIVGGGTFDLVFNLASYGVDPSQTNDRKAQTINAALPRLLAEVASVQPNCRLIHVGSAAEYGTATGDLNEDTRCEPTSLYGRSKRDGTHAVVESTANACVARLFTVYGEGERPGRLLPSLITAAVGKTGIDLTSGHQQRDFTHVGDVAEGLLRLAVSTSQHRLVNMCTGQLHSVRDFCTCAARVLGICEGHLRFGVRPDRDDEMKHERVNIERLKLAIGWQPQRTITDGILKTWNSVRGSEDR